MFLTTKGRYAIIAMIDIIANGNGTTPVSIPQIASRQNVSTSYLEQIFLLLKKNNIVRAVKGPGGGYIPMQPPEKISIFSILQSVGEVIKVTKCNGITPCLKQTEKCKTHHIWQTFENKMINYLTSLTIADIIKPDSNFFK